MEGIARIQQAFRCENKSRPVGGCGLVARPTFETGVFTQTLIIPVGPLNHRVRHASHRG
jgi:hypothetical protein